VEAVRPMKKRVLSACLLWVAASCGTDVENFPLGTSSHSVTRYPNDIPPDQNNFLTRKGTSSSEVADAYYAAIDPVYVDGVGQVKTGAASRLVQGCGTNFSSFFVPGDIIRIAGQVRTVTKVGGYGIADHHIDAVAKESVAPDTSTHQTFYRATKLQSETRQTTTRIEPVRAERQVQQVSCYPIDRLWVTTPFDPPIDSWSSYERVGEKTTFDRWKTVNGFTASNTVTAVYFNSGDLGFGRRMIATTSGTAAFSVTNYVGADAAAAVDEAVYDNLADRVATVTMEHSPISTAGTHVTKFYVFNGQGARVGNADLDGRGDKFVPNLCMACHAGDANRTPGATLPASFPTGWPDVQAKFLPFDLDSFQYSTLPGYTRPEQENAFRSLNERVLVATDPTTTLADLIRGWYGATSTPLPQVNQSSDWVPTGWDIPNGSQATSPRRIYLEVVKPSCRTCHAAQTGYTWASYGDFNSLWGSIEYDVCASQMPHALLTYQNFWRTQQPLELFHATKTPLVSGSGNVLTGWNAYSGTPCADIRAFYGLFVDQDQYVPVE
jgi:cytochrome c5